MANGAIIPFPPSRGRVVSIQGQEWKCVQHGVMTRFQLTRSLAHGSARMLFQTLHTSSAMASGHKTGEEVGRMNAAVSTS